MNLIRLNKRIKTSRYGPAMCFGKTLKREKLPNSGDTLKLMILNYTRKIISGWNNYPCKVITHKIDENKMGNRGSKSEFI